MAIVALKKGKWVVIRDLKAVIVIPPPTQIFFTLVQMIVSSRWVTSKGG